MQPWPLSVNLIQPRTRRHSAKLKKATTLLQRMPNKDLQRLRAGEEPRVILRDLFNALKDVAKAAGVKLT